MISLKDVSLNDYPILLTLDKIIDFLNTYDDKEKILKIFEISSMMTHFTCAYDYRTELYRSTEVHDIFKLINVYGYGICKQFTLLMQFLLDLFEIDNNVIYLGLPSQNQSSFDHFAIEVYLDNKAYYFDPDLHLYFINQQKDIASLSDLQNNNIHTWVGDFNAQKWINANPELMYLNDTEIFRKYYHEMFEQYEYFTLDDSRFPYKKELMANRGGIKWYQYLEKNYFFKNITITETEHPKGVVNGVLIAASETLTFHNLLFSFSKKKPTHQIEINDFPLLIIGCFIEYDSTDNSEIDILINGEKYTLHIHQNEDIIEKILTSTNIFQKPIYSFALFSKHKIKQINIQCQRSIFIQKIVDYIDTHHLNFKSSALKREHETDSFN